MFISLVLVCFTANAQRHRQADDDQRQAEDVDESKPHIYLQSGDYVFGNTVSLELNTKGRIFSRERDDRLIVDDRTFSADSVLFFNDGEDYYAYIGMMQIPKAPRTLEGRISLYRVEIDRSSMDHTTGHRRHRTEVVEFFSHNKKPAQQLRMDSLALAVENYPPAKEVMDLSISYGRRAIIANYSALGVLATMGIVGLVRGSDSEPDPYGERNALDDFLLIKPFSSTYANLGLCFVLPAGLYITGWVYLRKAKEYVYKTIHVYNRQ